MELQTYLTILWRRKWIIAITAFVTVAIVGLGTSGIEPQFAASGTLRMSTIDADGVKSGELDYADRVMNTYGTVLKAFLITSAEPGDGKSTIVANLALAMAKSGRKIIVVDSDLRLPTLHKIFELNNEVGLSNVLRHEVSLPEAIQYSHIAGVQVLTSGPLPPNPVDLLDTPQMQALIEYLKKHFDLVLLDTPALLPVIDAAVLAPMVDGVVMIIRRAQTRQEAVQAAQQQLNTVKAVPVGIVVNQAQHDNRYDYYHHMLPQTRK